MAKSRPVRRKRVRLNYSFFRIVGFYGTQRISRDELPLFIQEFIIRYGVDSTNALRKNDIISGYVNMFIGIMDSLPLHMRPYRVELRTPVGEMIRCWSRVKSWNYPDLDKTGEVELVFE